MKLHFTKMQGIGNDYVYVNVFERELPHPGELAKKISDRHFGVGSDGLVLIGPSTKADACMRMFNADGSEAEMCGNASRCVAKFLHDHGIVSGDTIRLETGAGIKTILLHFTNGEVTGATVDMGEPVLEPAAIPVMPGSEGRNPDTGAFPLDIDGTAYVVTPVSMGNPHAVLFVDDLTALDLPRLGPLFENHPCFPKRVNTEFVKGIDRNKIRMRVWERGAGETLACGTGACAALVASALNGLTGRSAEVELTGGVLRVEWKSDNHVYMTGPAVTVFTGDYLM